MLDKKAQKNIDKGELFNVTCKLSLTQTIAFLKRQKLSKRQAKYCGDRNMLLSLFYLLSVDINY